MQASVGGRYEVVREEKEGLVCSKVIPLCQIMIRGCQAQTMKTVDVMIKAEFLEAVLTDESS